MGRWTKGIASHWIFERAAQASALVRALNSKDALGFGPQFEERGGDFDKWLKYYFGDLLTLTSPKHQQDWIDLETAKRNERKRREWTCAFRGSSKSTIKAILAPLWRVCEKLEDYIVWVSCTELQAYSRRQAVMELLEDNPRLLTDYGDLRPDMGEKPWSRERAITRTRIYLESYGINSVPRGLLRASHRPSMIVMDDINSEDNQQTPLQRQKLLDKFDDVIMKLGPPDGSCNYIGVSTPNHSEGLESEIKKRGTWTYREYPGIICESTASELWDQWRMTYLDLRLGEERRDRARDFYLANRERMDKDSQVAWPEVASYYDYYVQRTENPGSFSKEIGLPLPIGLCPIDPEMQKLPVGDCSLFRIKGNHLIITRGPRVGDEIDLDECEDYGFLDPAVGEKPTADYAAIARICTDKHGYKYVLEIWCRVASKGEYLRAYLDMHKRRRFIMAGFESNGFQTYLKDEWDRIESEEYRQGVKMNIFKVRNIGKKLARMVSAIQTPMQNHHLAFNEFIVYSKPEVWTQFINLGTSENDDAPDSVASCLRMIDRYA